MPPSPPPEPTLDALKPMKVEGLPPAAYYIPNFITEEEEELLLRKIADSPQPKWRTTATGRRLQYWGGTLTKSGVLVPEPLPEWLTAYPDIAARVDRLLDAAAGVEGRHVLGVNQVLVNEYAPGQGISPHEDGPAFRPLVATLSLGSSSVLDLHHYISPSAPSPPMIPADGAVGRAIAAVPLGHVLLLPRSLFVLSGSAYSAHLHGIAPRSADWVVRDEAAAAAAVEGEGEAPPVVVANAGLLADAPVQAAIASDAGWRAERGTRVSLTFRHAEKSLKGGAFAMVGGRMQRS
ncbi:hypothetical protein Q8F55_007627 [Vanrija albida]|uniref:Fe2OG dioxygenase domain-containing protein n=1 Tax=Vanrija albida TaxID=181172 RepID=A0ABR3PU13_9TREE